MSRMLSPSKLSVLVERPRSQRSPAASFIYRPYLEFFNYRGIGGYSAAPGIRTLNPVKGDWFQVSFLTNSDGQHICGHVFVRITLGTARFIVSPIELFPVSALIVLSAEDFYFIVLELTHLFLKNHFQILFSSRDWELPLLCHSQGSSVFPT